MWRPLVTVEAAGHSGCRWLLWKPLVTVKAVGYSEDRWLQSRLEWGRGRGVRGAKWAGYNVDRK